MNRFSVLATCAIALPMFTAGQAGAVVNTLGYYRLGETEGGVNGNGVTQAARDASPNNNHYINNQPAGNSYSNAISFAAANNTGSTMGVAMNGSNGGFYGITTQFPDSNVGVELFVETNDASKANNFLAGTRANTGGIGVMQDGNVWKGVIGNVTYVGSAPLLANQWVHLAIVRDNGTTTFYANGVPRAVSNSVPISSGAPHMGVISGGSVRFGGTLDEVRMFNFTPGTFNPADLLINQNLSLQLNNGSFEALTAGQPNHWNVMGNVMFGGGEGTTDGAVAAIFNAGNTTPNGEVMQTFATTVGREYRVEFDFGKFAVGAGTARVTVDAFNAFDFTNLTSFIASDTTGANSNIFERYSFTFFAQDEFTTLRFTDTSIGTNSFDAVLDRVSVVMIIPEPATATLGILGLAGLMIRRRRIA